MRTQIAEPIRDERDLKGRGSICRAPRLSYSSEDRMLKRVMVVGVVAVVAGCQGPEAFRERFDAGTNNVMPGAAGTVGSLGGAGGLTPVLVGGAAGAGGAGTPGAGGSGGAAGLALAGGAGDGGGAGPGG